MMTRKAWKKRPNAEKLPEEIEAFIFSIFRELEYGAESIEEAVLGVAPKATGVVKQYIRQVEAHEHDAVLLDLVWKRAARRGGYIVRAMLAGFCWKCRRD